MDKQEITDMILDMLEEVCADSAVREERDIDLFEAGLLDSLGAMEVLVEIESQFGLEIAPTEIAREDMNTVNLIIERVVERL